MSKESMGNLSSTPDSSMPEPTNDNLIEFPSQTGMGIEETNQSQSLESSDAATSKLEVAEPNQRDAGDFFTPEQGTEIAEANSNPEPNLSEADHKTLADLGLHYESEADLEKQLDLYAEEKTGELENYLKTIQELGLDGSPATYDTLSAARLEDLEHINHNLAETKSQISQLEDVFLQIEGLEDTENQLAITRKIELRTPTPELLEANMKELRKQIVLNDIKEWSGPWLEKECRQYFEDAQNSKKAKLLAAFKIRAYAWKLAQRFIEEGGTPDYGGFLVTFVRVETKHDGKTINYISEINLTRGHGSASEERSEKDQTEDDSTSQDDTRLAA